MMKRLVALALLPLLLATGCAFGNKTSTLAPGGYAAVNERSARQEATLRLEDGTSRHARNLRLEAGTASFVDPATGAPTALPVERIAQVRYSNRARGALVGATWGYVICAAIGFVAGTAEDDAGFGLASGLANAGPACYLAGLPLGAAVGADDVYQLPTTPRSP